MATVAIWKINNNLNQVINYTTDKNKTDVRNYIDLENSLKYIANDLKTENKLFVDGINCNPNSALKEMTKVKKHFMKTDGVLGWHAYQSFKEGEVTPEEAHQIGMEVAQEMWGDRFQVVVSTHLNTNHYHNHFVINSVSFVDGKKYNANRTSYAELRRISNEICKEHGKSFLEEKKTKSGLNYSNYQQKNLVYSNYYKTAKKDIDMAISISKNYDEFKKVLINMGYEIKLRSNKLSICGKEYRRNIRIERYFGNDYSIDNIKKRIAGSYLVVKHKAKYNKQTADAFKEIFRPKYNSFYYLYKRYCYLIKLYPYYVKTNYISKELKQDISKLNLYSKEANFLENNKINTDEDFKNLYLSKEKELTNLLSQRDYLNKHQNNDSKYNQIKKEINNVKNELKMCSHINQRKNIINNEINNLDEKEMILNEYIR